MTKVILPTKYGNNAKNQYVLIDGVTTYFHSYSSVCAEYNNETKTLTLFKDWNYSKTTMAYLGVFLRAFAGFKRHGVAWLKGKKQYQDIKICFGIDWDDDPYERS